MKIGHLNGYLIVAGAHYPTSCMLLTANTGVPQFKNLSKKSFSPSCQGSRIPGVASTALNNLLQRIKPRRSSAPAS